MKGGEEERVREKAKGRKRRSEHRDRSVILLDCARSPVTFECSVDFTLAKGEHRRKKKKKTRTSIPSAGFLLSSFFLVPGPFPPPPLPIGPFPRAISPFLPSKHRFFSRFFLYPQFSFDPRRSKKHPRYDLYPRSRSRKRRRREGGKERDG